MRVEPIPLLLVALALLLLVPWQPHFVDTALLDDSWKLALNELTARGADHGSEVVFTYGPLGFVLLDCYHPVTFPAMLLLRAIWAMALAIGSWKMADAGRWPTIPTLVWASLLLGTAAINVEAVAFSVPALWVWLHLVSRGRHDAATTLAAAATAVVSLTKASLVLPTWGAAALVALDDLLRQRRVPRGPTVFAAAWLALWLGTGQPLSAVPRVLRAVLELSRGYTFEMSMLEVDPGILLGYLLVGACAWWLASRAAWQRLGWHGVLLATHVPITTFAAYKLGVVRYGSYASTVALLLLVLVLLPLAWTSVARPRLRWASLLLPAGAATLSSALLTLNGTDLLREVGNSFVRIPPRALAAARLLTGTARFPDQYERARGRIRAEWPAPAVSGTVDVYSHAIGAVLARDMDYRPRPVIQSYAAYTPWLARLNARHLESPRAPDSILFRPSSIDHRYWSLDDGLSWPSLLTRYDIGGYREEYLVLGRSRAPRRWELAPILETRLRLGETLRVPPVREPIWARLQVRWTPLGRGLGFLFRSPETTLRWTRSPGAEPREHRLVVGTASEGFLLSPVVVSGLDFAVLAANPPGQRSPLPRVRRLSVHVGSSRPSLWVDPDVEVSLYALRFPRQDLTAVPDLADVPAYLEMTRDQPLSDSLVVTVTPEGRVVLFAHPPRTLPLQVPRGVTGIDVGYGLFPQVWTRTAGVEFLVWGESEGQGRRLLFSRGLRTVDRPADRGLLSQRIDFGPDTFERLVFETRALTHLDWAWSFWGALRWRRDAPSALPTGDGSPRASGPSPGASTGRGAGARPRRDAGAPGRRASPDGATTGPPRMDSPPSRAG